MNRSSGGPVVLALLALATLGSATACHRDPSPRIRIKAVERCEDGSAIALAERTERRALRVYHRECAGVFFEPNCAREFDRAGKMGAESGDRATLAACQKDYCSQPLLSRPEACNAGFTPTPANTPRALEELESAIIAYDARGYAPRVEDSRVRFFAKLVERFGPRALPKPAPVTDGKAP
jgi:hypothetical protein